MTSYDRESNIPVTSQSQLPQLCPLPTSNVFPVFVVGGECGKITLDVVHAQFMNNKYYILLLTLLQSQTQTTAPYRLL